MVAALAHLRLFDEEVSGLQDDLASILEYVERLDELDLEEVPPMYSPTAARENVWREDVVRDARVTAAFLEGAPDVEGSHVRVPRVVDTRAAEEQEHE